MSRPPRLARWILSRRLPVDEREFALGDLEEEYTARAATSRREANRWYWRQGRSSLHSGRRRRYDGQQRSTLERLRRLAAATAQDLRYGLRSLRTSWTVTVIAAFTLAIGIGANTAIYSVIDAILLRPLPYADAERLVVLQHVFLDGRPGNWMPSFPDYVDYEAANETFEHLVAWQELTPSLTSDDGSPAIRIGATGITWNFMPALGVEPVLGRGFRAEEDDPGAGDRVALLSHGLWQRRFGADPNVLGTTIRLDGTAYTVVGVMPASFTGNEGGGFQPDGPTDIWMPYRNSLAAEGSHLRGLANVSVFGKIRPDVTLHAARQDIAAVAASLTEHFPDMKSGEGARLVPAHEAVVGAVQPMLWVLFGAVSFVLLIACTNVANLLLGRMATRRREVAVRMALGAGHGRVARQVLVESLLLGALGGALACGLAWGLLAANGRLAAFSLPRLDGIAIDGRVLLFALGMSLLTGLLFGIIPAVQAARGDMQAALKSGDRGTGPGERLRQALVVAEVAMSVVLLVGAGLLIRSFDKAVNIDPGFDARRILTADLQLPMPFVSEEEWPQAVSFFAELVDRLEVLPGVEAAAAAYQLPVDGGWNNSFTLPDRPPPAPGEDEPSAIFRPVSPGYFELAGISVVRGRTITAGDHADAPRVVVVNEAFVREFFADVDNPLGKQIDYGNWWAGGPPEYEIVGVVADVLFGGRTDQPYPALYFPHAQQPVREMTVMLKTRGEPMELAEALRAEVAALDPGLPVDNIVALEALLGETEAVRQALALLTTLFAASALALAAVGVYGVMSFSVAQRTRELGIRLALGARAADVRTMVIGSGLRLALGGLVLGLLGAAALSTFIETLLFEVEPIDPATLATVSVFLGGIACLACWLPARRATRVDPIASLRAD